MQDRNLRLVESASLEWEREELQRIDANHQEPGPALGFAVALGAFVVTLGGMLGAVWVAYFVRAWWLA